MTCVDRDTLLTDGPFIESEGQKGGISIIDVADLDEALAQGGMDGRRG